MGQSKRPVSQYDMMGGEGKGGGERGGRNNATWKSRSEWTENLFTPIMIISQRSEQYNF